MYLHTIFFRSLPLPPRANSKDGGRTCYLRRLSERTLCEAHCRTHDPLTCPIMGWQITQSYMASARYAHVGYLSSSCADIRPAMPVSYSPIHTFQCRAQSRCSRTRKFHLPGVYQLTSPEYIPNRSVPRRRTKEMTMLVMLQRASYQALLELPLLDHRVVVLPCFPSHRQRICEDWLAVACTIQILRLSRFGWYLAPLDDTK